MRVVVFVPLVSLLVVVPPMIMFEAAARPMPVTGVIAALEVVRLYPVRAWIRCARPIAIVPAVMLAFRIPVAFNPFVVGSWPLSHVVHAWRRRGTNVHVDRHLSARGRGCANDQHQRGTDP